MCLDGVVRQDGVGQYYEFDQAEERLRYGAL